MYQFDTNRSNRTILFLPTMRWVRENRDAQAHFLYAAAHGSADSFWPDSSANRADPAKRARISTPYSISNTRIIPMPGNAGSGRKRNDCSRRFPLPIDRRAIDSHDGLSSSDGHSASGTAAWVM